MIIVFRCFRFFCLVGIFSSLDGVVVRVGDGIFKRFILKYLFRCYFIFGEMGDVWGIDVAFIFRVGFLSEF